MTALFRGFQESQSFSGKLRLESRPVGKQAGFLTALQRDGGYGIAPVGIACAAKSANLKWIGRAWRQTIVVMKRMTMTGVRSVHDPGFPSEPIAA